MKISFFFFELHMCPAIYKYNIQFNLLPEDCKAWNELSEYIYNFCFINFINFYKISINFSIIIFFLCNLHQDSIND